MWSKSLKVAALKLETPSGSSRDNSSEDGQNRSKRPPLQTYPVHHEENGAVVCDRSYRNIKSYDLTKLGSPLNVTDESVACSIKQIAGNATLGEGQLVPDNRGDRVIRTWTWFYTICVFLYSVPLEAKIQQKYDVGKLPYSYDFKMLLKCMKLFYLLLFIYESNLCVTDS